MRYTHPAAWLHDDAFLWRYRSRAARLQPPCLTGLNGVQGLQGLGGPSELTLGGGGFTPLNLSPDLYLPASATQMRNNLAASFNGTNGLLKSSGTVNITGRAAWAIALWFKCPAPAGADQYLFDNDGNINIRIEATTGNLLITDSSGFASGVANNAWRLFVLSYTGGQMYYSLDGATLNAQGATTASVNGTLTLGSLADGTLPLAGLEDSVGVWIDRALNDADVAALWNSGNGATYSALSAAMKVGLYSWFDFQEDVTSGTRSDRVGNLPLSDVNSNVPAAVGLVSGPCLDTDPCSLWLDISGNADNGAQTANTQRLVFVANAINGQPGVNGTDAFPGDFLDLLVPRTYAGPFTVYFAAVVVGGKSTVPFGSASGGNYVQVTTGFTRVTIAGTVYLFFATFPAGPILYRVRRDVSDNVHVASTGNAEQLVTAGGTGTFTVDQIGAAVGSGNYLKDGTYLCSVVICPTDVVTDNPAGDAAMLAWALDNFGVTIP